MQTKDILLALVTALALIAAPVAASAEEATAEDLVNALNAIFGKHVKGSGDSQNFPDAIAGLCGIVRTARAVRLFPREQRRRRTPIL